MVETSEGHGGRDSVVETKGGCGGRRRTEIWVKWAHLGLKLDSFVRALSCTSTNSEYLNNATSILVCIIAHATFMSSAKSEVCSSG